jgi:hypothetical protein
MADNPGSYRKDIQFGHATIPGSVGNTFEYRDGRQQTPMAVSQFSAKSYVYADNGRPWNRFITREDTKNS